MIKVVALDEMGQFESRDSGIRFVGGYTLSLWNYEEENLKIESFLKEFCQDFNNQFLSRYPDIAVCYPQSLHGSGKTFFRQKNPGNARGSLEAVSPRGELEQIERNFRRLLEEKTAQYIRGKGGQLYAYLDPFVGEENADRENIGTSNILNSSYGANFYERMATLALFNQTFYTTDEDYEGFSFELATRTLNTSDEEWASLYDVYKNAKEEFKSSITNTSTYKTAVAAMLYSESVDKAFLGAKYRFHVKSINYYSANGTTPFLYLADIICSYIRRKFQQEFSINLKTTENRIDTAGLLKLCTNSGIQVRIYDKSDALFRKMVQAVKEGEIAEYCHLKYLLINSNLFYQGFYTNYWLPQLEEYLGRRMLNKDFRERVKSRIPEFVAFADGFMGAREINYETGLFIAESLAKIVSMLNDYRERKLMLFRLYDIILRGYNHRGSICEAQACISKCEEYKSTVGIEEYIAHTLRTLTFYFNAMRYEAALKAGLMLEVPVCQLKKVYASAYNTSSKISSSITNDRNNIQNYQFPIAGKLYSSIGQAYGFLNQYGTSKKYFLKALKEFEKNSADYAITLSHFLHLLISHKKKSDYELYAQIYFGESDLWNQMEKAFSAKDGGFSLFVFVKGFNVFYAKDKGNKNVLSELLRRISLFNGSLEHPWELIYKNLYEAMLKQPTAFRKEEYAFVKDRAVNCIKDADATIKMIQLFIRLKSEGVPGNVPIQEVLTCGEICTCELFIADTKHLSSGEFMDRLTELLTYSYG